MHGAPFISLSFMEQMNANYDVCTTLTWLSEWPEQVQHVTMLMVVLLKRIKKMSY